jgi:ABC-type phosphate transport system substrate-binding protein
MKKQITGSLAATAALLAIAGIAQAAPAELNIYGASAQYTYWNAQAQNFASSRLGCTAAAPTNSPDGKHGFVSAKSCTSTLVPVNSVTNKRDLDIRYSGIASAEGPLAVLKKAPLDANLLKNITGFDVDKKPIYGTTVCNANNGERAMADSASTASCHTVHVGTSDVAGESLTQVSSGQKLGPMGGGAFSVTMTSIDTSSLTPNNTVVVPFGFFVNKNVTAQQCTTGLVGNYCTTNAHCKLNDGTAGTCGAAAPISNISREEASLLFSGYVADWSDLGAYFTPQPVVACLRHAGSGTHAAFDLTVMNSLWGANIATAETPGFIWFNQGSSDEIKCVNGATTATPNGSLIGAIGYADADQATGVANTSQNVIPVKYNGQFGTRTALRNGQYDFFTNAWLYTNGPTTGVAAELVAFAKDPANVPASKINYWAAQDEMKFNRGADNTYPAFVGAASPMLP